MEHEILTVVGEAWNRPFSTRSNFARDNAEVIAMCACLGYITTRLTSDAYGNTWKATAEGLALLDEAAKEIALEQPSFDFD